MRWSLAVARKLIMKIAHLTSVHARYDTRIFYKECRSLAAAGHDVTLIVADGNGNESRDGVRILDAGKASSRLGRMLSSVNAVCSLAISIGADVYHLHDPELLRAVSRISRREARIVFDAHEDLPRQILSKPWIPTPLRSFASWGAELVENRMVRRLDGIVAATPHIRERFRPFNPHVIDVNNYPLPDELTAASSAGNASICRSQICYVGGITHVRGIGPLVRALALMPDVTLALCGRFQEAGLEAEMRTLPGWRQVDFRGQVDRVGVRQVMAESMAGVVTLLPTPAYLEALPVKMFEYMSAELPVIASDFPLWRRIVEDAGAGVCIDPQSPEEIARAICGLRDDPSGAVRMGQAGRKAVLDRYNWSHEAAKLTGFYQGLE